MLWDSRTLSEKSNKKSIKYLEIPSHIKVGYSHFHPFLSSIMAAALYMRPQTQVHCSN